MDAWIKQKADKNDCSEGEQQPSAAHGRKHTVLSHIKEVQRECGNGVNMLPVVLYERKLWFFDKPLRQLRNVRNPHDFIDLNEFEMEYFLRRVI